MTLDDVRITADMFIPLLSALKDAFFMVLPYPHIEDALTKISDGVYEFKVSLADEDVETQQAWKQVMGEWMPDDDYIVFTSFGPNSATAEFQILAGPVSSIVMSGSGSNKFVNLTSGHFFRFGLDGNLISCVKVR